MRRTLCRKLLLDNGLVEASVIKGIEKVRARSDGRAACGHCKCARVVCNTHSSALKRLFVSRPILPLTCAGDQEGD